MSSDRLPAAAGSRLGKIVVLMVVCCFVATLTTYAQQPAVRVTQAIDETKLVKLSGNVHPLARAEYDRGVAADSQRLNRMILLLGRSPEQEKALRMLLEEQQSPGSANYHKWLTPSQFGQRFGVSETDMQTVAGWLATNGFEITRLSKSRNFVEFNGTAGQLRQAFHTQIHKYSVEGKEHWANSTDPQIPVALAPVVKGFVSLNNFPYRYYSHRMGNFSRNLTTGIITPHFDSNSITPQLTTGGDSPYYGLSPADFATVYNSLPLLSAGNDGTGQAIAIVGETNINPDDIAHFRSIFGLGPGNTQIIIDGFDPGITSVGEETEAIMDIEWSSAVAPGATVKYVAAASTEVTQGVDLSALYIVENDLAGVMSESYGQCEARIGEGANLFRLYLSEQAAAQGMTVVVSSGDNGSAGCDSPSSQLLAASGLGVNGLASTPFNVAVGGTDYNVAGNFGDYWNATNTSITAGSYELPFASAKGYIPEMTWNDSCGTLATADSLGVCANKGSEFGGLTLWAGSGGKSSCAVRAGASCTGYPKPSWQIPLTPNDGVRDLPDVSFFAAGSETSSKSFYVLCQSDALQSGSACVPDENNSISFSAGGGTSAGAPSFAGVVALAMQKAGSRLGNINYLLYSVPQSSYQDVTAGTISMPCVAGSPNCSSSGGTVGVLVDSNSNPAYPTTAGYDLATGLGTPNIANLVDALATAANGRNSTTTTLTLNGGTATVTATHGSPITVAIDVANASGTGSGPAGDVALVSSTGIAIDGTSSSYPLVVGDSGHSTVSWASPYLPGGTYDVYANYSGDDVNAPSRSGNISVNIAPEDSKVFAIMETCSGNSLTGAYTGSITVNYGDCYFMRYDVADAETGQFIGLFAPIVTSKCTDGIASCPTGNLTITENGTPVSGTFMLNPYAYTEDRVINFSGGTHALVVTYPGDPSYNGSSATMTVTVNKANASVSQPTSTPSSPKTGDSVKLVVNVTSLTTGLPPTGTVTFYDNGTAMTGTLTMTGKPATGSAGASTLAVLTTSFSTAGTHTVRAQYDGDDNYNASPLSTAKNVVVTAGTPVAPAITAPTASLAPALLTVPVTLTTTVSPVSGSGATTAPAGTVTFLDNGTALAGTVNYSTTGTTLTATLSYTFTATGTHSITTQYSGDSRYTTATSSALSLNVAQPYSIALDQNSISRTGGGSGTVTLTLSPATGFTGNVNVSCASSSAEASCSVQSNPASLTSGTNATDTITYTVPALSSALDTQHPFAPWKALNGMVLAGVFLLGIPGVRRRGRWMLTLVMLASAMLLVSCGGGGSTTPPPPPPPQPVTYTFTVNTSLAADSSVSSSAQFTVTVN